ncbi:hypothetical protein JCM15765_45030 [Paradesulfitobacterium aromaticivorans]
MVVALFQEQIDFHLFIRRSLEALTEDLEFLFGCLRAQVSLAAVYVEGYSSGFPRTLLRQTCESLPVRFAEYLLPDNAGPDEAVALINSLNKAEDIHGLIADLPPFSGFTSEQLSALIDPRKSVQLNNSDYLPPWEYDLTPHEQEVLRVLIILEKTFSAAAEQIARARGHAR